jgi:hypothetical protein
MTHFLADGSYFGIARTRKFARDSKSFQIFFFQVMDHANRTTTIVGNNICSRRVRMIQIERVKAGFHHQMTQVSRCKIKDVGKGCSSFSLSFFDLGAYHESRPLTSLKGI